jgi:hypothetical protein
MRQNMKLLHLTKLKDESFALRTANSPPTMDLSNGDFFILVKINAIKYLQNGEIINGLSHTL